MPLSPLHAAAREQARRCRFSEGIPDSSGSVGESGRSEPPGPVLAKGGSHAFRGSLKPPRQHQAYETKYRTHRNPCPRQLVPPPTRKMPEAASAAPTPMLLSGTNSVIGEINARMLVTAAITTCILGPARKFQPLDREAVHHPRRLAGPLARSDRASRSSIPAVLPHRCYQSLSWDLLDPYDL